MNIQIFYLGTVQLVHSGMQNSCKNKKYDKNIDRKRKELHVCVALKVLVGASVKWEVMSPVGGDVSKG